ncbi:MAG: hypothetical protein Q9168_003721 [Polycauliona sp. 1 TL-2023]
MSGLKRSPPSQEFDGVDGKGDDRKRTRSGLSLLPPNSLPPAPNNPSQWAESQNTRPGFSSLPPNPLPPAPCNPSHRAENRNASIVDSFDPSQPTHQTSSANFPSDSLLSADPPPLVSELQRPLSPIRSSSRPPPMYHAIEAPLSFSRFSERPMPRNKDDMTGLRKFNEIILPRWLAEHPEGERNAEAAECRQLFVKVVASKRLELVCQVEKWRMGQKNPFGKGGEEDDKNLRSEWDERQKKTLWKLLWGEEQQRYLMNSRILRDRRNMTDYVNGLVEAVHRGKMMDWPLLIPMYEWVEFPGRDCTLQWQKREGGDVDWRV